MSLTQAELGNARPTRPWPADQSERWPIERLIPYANNARVHTEADLAKIAASIARWGWTMPVLVDEEGVLIAGHARVGAAAKLGLTSIPIMIARSWSAEEKKAYRLADNQLAVRAIWDPDLLSQELQELDFRGFDLGLVGFEPGQLKTILAGLGASGLADPDSVPEVPEQPVTRCGDLWLLGDHRVGCGDSTSASDVAPVLAGSAPHLMVADPPYGATSRRGARAAVLVPVGSHGGKCLTTIAPTGARPMRCFPGMLLMSGTGRCTAMLSPSISPPAGCSCALRSSGSSSTLH
jgi:hypothetical protein